MPDYESRDLATAARRAQEAMAGDDDRPSVAEVADYVTVETAEREAGEAARKATALAIAEVVVALRERGFYTAATYIADNYAWTRTDHGYDEEGGW